MAQPFSLLASVYDDIMIDIDYEGWVDFMLALLKERDWQQGKALDLGCGTANSTIPLFARGVEVTGLDFSEDMLLVAREKFPVANFVQADFRDFELDETFTLCYAIFDTINNLLTDDDFLKTAKSVHRHLEKDGFFIFDVNTTEGLKYLWDSGRAEGYVNDVHYHWTHYFNDETGIATIEAFCEKGKQAFTEIHYERAYDESNLRNLLKQAGFTTIECVTYPQGQKAEVDEARLWVIARV